MFDYHLHSKLSFDSTCEPCRIVAAAERQGLKEICFTDHYDFNDVFVDRRDIFTLQEYRDTYDSLESDKVKIRRGVEFGLTQWNQNELDDLLASYDFDFVLGSVHYAGGYDPYFEEFWTHNGMETAFEKYLLQTLECVRTQRNFDVLGHLNYVCKSLHSPTRKPMYYNDYADICDSTLRCGMDFGQGFRIDFHDHRCDGYVLWSVCDACGDLFLYH